MRDVLEGEIDSESPARGAAILHQAMRVKGLDREEELLP